MSQTTLQLSYNDLTDALRTTVEHMVSFLSLSSSKPKHAVIPNVAATIREVVQSELEVTTVSLEQLEAFAQLLRQRDRTDDADAVERTRDLLQEVYKEQP